MFSALPKPTREQEASWSTAGQMLYAQAGLTLAHEGATHAAELEVSSAPPPLAPTSRCRRVPLHDRPREDHFSQPGQRLGQVRQAPEDWWREDHRRRVAPGEDRLVHHAVPHGGPGGEKNWRGEPTMPQDDLNTLVKQVYDMNVPLIVHTNGDATIDMFLTAYEFARAGDFSRPWNVTTIHTQFMRKDHIDEVREVQDPALVLHPAHVLLRDGPHEQPRAGAGGLHQPDARRDRRRSTPDEPHGLLRGAARPDVHDVVGREPRLA